MEVGVFFRGVFMFILQMGDIRVTEAGARAFLRGDLIKNNVVNLDGIS